VFPDSFFILDFLTKPTVDRRPRNCIQRK